MKTTVTNPTEYHHMSDWGDRPPDLNGMTVRQALKALRSVFFGDMGGTYIIYLSDNTCMAVVLYECADGSRLMRSQYVHRWTIDNGRQVTLRKYKLP